MKTGKERNIHQYWETILGFLVEDNAMLVNGVAMSKRILGDKHGRGEDEGQAKS